MISTRKLSLLPDTDEVRQRLQALAMLDAILCPEWEFRYYSFNSAWAPGEQMGSMRNGSGDDVFAHFGAAGCWIKGFVHDSPMTPYRDVPQRIWPGVYEAVPSDFANCLEEPAFRIQDVTFCIWRKVSDSSWHIGPIAFPAEHPDPDGSESLLSLLDGRAESYHDWAETYYDCDLSLEAVEHVYQRKPLTAEVVKQLNSEVSLDELAEDITEIGYPGP